MLNLIPKTYFRKDEIDSFVFITLNSGWKTNQQTIYVFYFICRAFESMAGECIIDKLTIEKNSLDLSIVQHIPAGLGGIYHIRTNFY